MCGITGMYGFGNKSISRSLLTRMTNCMDHRGPDDSGVQIIDRSGMNKTSRTSTSSKRISSKIGQVGLGHRRLAIIDLSPKGHQPMSDKEQSVWITYNGEIYNFQSIKKKLKSHGHKFTAQSDTEVIIAAYKQWGIDCIKKFNGMFAFALYDATTDELYVVRDRLGIKPLYYTTVDNTFVFGSELKAILTHPKFKRKPNLKAISAYLSFRYDIGDETLFDGISKLLPGHYMKVQEGGKKKKIEITQYWDIPLQNTAKRSFSYYKSKVRTLLEKAVKRRMLSDVPVGAYLSGGLDSSIIVSQMAKQAKHKVKTFSIGFKESGFNELEYANLVAKRSKTDHTNIMLSAKNYLSTMKKLIQYKDLPLSVPNEVPIYLLSKELKKHITVVLSGEGADEIFSGYGRIYRSTTDYHRLKKIKKLPKSIQRAAFKKLHDKYAHHDAHSELDHFLSQYTYFPWKEKKEIFNTATLKAANKDKYTYDQFEQTFDSARRRSFADKLAYTFEKLHLPGLLQRLDCPTMAASVEGRVPFVDHELVEFMFSVPQQYKMKWKSTKDFIASLWENSDAISEQRDVTKYVLREAFKHDIPQEVLTRKKQGFPVPLDFWFRQDFAKLAQKELLKKTARIKTVVDQKKLKKWINTHMTREDPQFGQKLWMLLNIEYWMQTYNL